MKKRVVVTGMGVIAPVGKNVEEFWKSISEGKSGIRTLEKFDTSEISSKVAACVVDFNPEEYIEKRSQKDGQIYPVRYSVCKNGYG